MKYSFIIPVYNGEKYIAQCLDSILAQTFRDFEAIVVDDGSADRSAEICASYARRDDRVRVLRKNNGGVSSARNQGMDQAQGEYIGFVDADDLVSPSLLSAAEKNGHGSDVILFGHTSGGQKDLMEEAGSIRAYSEEKSRALANNIYDKGGYAASKVTGKLYKRSVVLDVRFCPEISIGEDKLFNFHAFLNASTFIYVPAAMYFYRRHSASITHRYIPNYIQMADATFAEYEKMLTACEDRRMYLALLSDRAVNVMRNVAEMDVCNPKNKAPWHRRRSEWRRALTQSRSGQYFSRCTGENLSERDLFYLRAYRYGFLRVMLMTRHKSFKAAEYMAYRLMGRWMPK